ncbi:HAD-like domain-containing protein [Syncephalastrum racemosum]|uniref:Mitochondrial import inner membrane translocase subunit TIM50 n=1 Tax=Syncephalastrum racemosum TaxID=13706 RepID=A0A1X2H619_SYNRA|nr:HAD-like domain-containing protein [Syncephalastrum racemosum]
MKEAEAIVPSPVAEDIAPVVKKHAPSREYEMIAAQPSRTRKHPQDQLLILDLNGTLVSRTKRNQGMYVRPYADEFLDHIFRHYKVMVWSSAQPQSVDNMLQLFGRHERRLAKVWDRTKFNLSPQEYHRKTVTIKDLEEVWKAFGGKYDATNTIMLDDSPAKAVLQPYNSVHLTEFDHAKVDCHEGESELADVRTYLRHLRYQSNVANYIKEHPYRCGQAIHRGSFKVYYYAFGVRQKRLRVDIRDGW